LFRLLGFFKLLWLFRLLWLFKLLWLFRLLGLFKLLWLFRLLGLFRVTVVIQVRTTAYPCGLVFMVKKVIVSMIIP
jgi:hypothetical protein